MGSATLLVWQTIKQLKMINLWHVFQQMAHLGVDSLPIISLTLLFVGEDLIMKKLDITTMPDYRKVEAVVQLLVNGTLTSYRIATDANISKMSILTLTKGTSKIKNITYQTAMALINWYEENHEKYGITIHHKAAG